MRLVTNSDIYANAVCLYNFECDGCNHYTPKVCFHVAVRRIKELERIIHARDLEAEMYREEAEAWCEKNERLEKIVRDVFMEDQ